MFFVCRLYVNVCMYVGTVAKDVKASTTTANVKNKIEEDKNILYRKFQRFFHIKFLKCEFKIFHIFESTLFVFFLFSRLLDSLRVVFVCRIKINRK